MALTLALLLMAVGLAVLGYGHYTAGRVFHGLSVQGVPVGGLTRQEALARLERALVENELPYVRLEDGARSWVYSSATLGGSLALEEAVDQAWHIGREGTFRYDLVTRIRLLWRGYNIVPSFRLEPGLSLEPLRQIALEAGAPPRRAQVTIAGIQVHNDDSQSGRDLDMAATQTGIVSAVTEVLGESQWRAEPRWRTLLENRAPATSSFPGEPIPVAVVMVESHPALDASNDLREHAETILGAPVTLVYDDTSTGDGTPRRREWAVDRATLGTWMSVNSDGDSGPAVVLDRAAMEAFLAGVAAGIDRPARQGRYGYDAAAATLSTIVPEQFGRQLDRAAALAALEAACTRTDNRVVALAVTVTEPPVTLATLQAMLPLDLISTGETSFAGSTAARAYNIQVATREFEGVIVAPNSRFSFVEHVGMVTIASGYADGWVIEGNQTVLGAGGGVCQVGTTFFRAVFWGGYPIVERTPHAYRVSWYEPPLGLDAAVLTPYVDVKFDNDQATPILIQTEVNSVTGKLAFRFYGRLPGRSVTMEGPVLGQTTPAGPAVFEPDASLSPGQRVQVETAHDGLKVTVYRVISVDGTVIAREPLLSDYQPWPARYLVGP